MKAEPTCQRHNYNVRCCGLHKGGSELSPEGRRVADHNSTGPLYNSSALQHTHTQSSRPQTIGLNILVCLVQNIF